ncbi:homocysteine S-methyltransferase family protein [Clostridium aestuarii]|uniref:Methionine synthase n=1 Tax=Clostridium aestuarii TaxID=338193 RepID=A0ABT4D4R1_9CLOT|nr:homocysteine S-methyltransferase family protein [Clostridium aestuarii]
MLIKDILGKRIIFFDGAMGTMLQKKGLRAGEIPEVYNMIHPEIITEIHEEYIGSGANVVTTNTFGANELKLKETGYSVEQVINNAVKIAKKAKGEKYVALDIGPIGQLMEPMGTLTFERAYEIFKRQVKAGAEAGCNLILIETISDIYEAKAAVLAVKENCDLPVFCTMTFGEDGRTLTGTDPLIMTMVLEGLGVDALGVNCSLGPKEMLPTVEHILEYSSIPVMIQPNAGLPRVENGNTVYDIEPSEFAYYIKVLAEKGAVVLGGCCGTTPEFIKEVKKELKGLAPKKVKYKGITGACSSSKTVILGNGVKVIGERINPTGKKKFKEALRENNIDYILTEAVNQKEAGADILDVNVGLPEIDEKKVMIETVKQIQSIINLPLQIDSTSGEVIEAAVRIYNGKPIINSINGKEQTMNEIFPIVKKYGTCVVGLTLDEKGIPAKAEDRVKIAERIIKKAESYGIPKENILIDCLVLTASAQQEEVMETIKAVRMVKEKFGVKTLLGVSNVSFGLPQREILNKTFLSMALAQGLDAPILNPMAEGIMDTIYAFRVLSNVDKDSQEFVKIYSNVEAKKEAVKVKADRDLKEIVINGMKDEAAIKTKEYLNTMSSMNVVNEYLIPALDIVGEKYEKGELFLPQLIQSAETVKKAFNVIKAKMTKEGSNNISKGKIILATVKGDIHDIGKNIVKILLENYGFEVVDLGKDVPIENVVETAKEQNIKLIGLSALMTTTVKSMEDTIKALKDNNIDCITFVGGAVLNQEYADMIGADYYAKDARKSVEIARKIFNE